MRVLGIDPGSRNLGFGIIDNFHQKLSTHAHGTLRFNTDLKAHERLLEIHTGVKNLLVQHQPDHVAIEKVFFAKDATSALKLGQVRGVVILAVAEAGIPLFEYSPNEIKQAVAGFGHADKQQVAKMVTLLLGTQDFKSMDASDALAIAICHLHTYKYKVRVRAYDRVSFRKVNLSR